MPLDAIENKVHSAENSALLKMGMQTSSKARGSNALNWCITEIVANVSIKAYIDKRPKNRGNLLKQMHQMHLYISRKLLKIGETLS